MKRKLNYVGRTPDHLAIMLTPFWKIHPDIEVVKFSLFRKGLYYVIAPMFGQRKIVSSTDVALKRRQKRLGEFFVAIDNF